MYRGWIAGSLSSPRENSHHTCLVLVICCVLCLSVCNYVNVTKFIGKPYNCVTPVKKKRVSGQGPGRV